MISCLVGLTYRVLHSIVFHSIKRELVRFVHRHPLLKQLENLPEQKVSLFQELSAMKRWQQELEGIVH
jgi:hypothetical protein